VNSDQTGRAGEYYVAAEIHRRGGYAVPFAGHMKNIDLLASDAEHERKSPFRSRPSSGVTGKPTPREGGTARRISSRTAFGSSSTWAHRSRATTSHASRGCRSSFTTTVRRRLPAVLPLVARAPMPASNPRRLRSGATAGTSSASFLAVPDERHCVPPRQHIGAGQQQAWPGRAGWP